MCPSACSDKTADKPDNHNRKRAKHTRTKLGCHTCKWVLPLSFRLRIGRLLTPLRVRRVRCDLTRPGCERCTKSGRTCDGYASESASQPARPTAVIGSHAVILAPKHSPSGGVLPKPQSSSSGFLLRFYQQHTAFELAGHFQDDFWSIIVPQTSEKEGCIRHITMALAALHASDQNSQLCLPQTDLPLTSGILKHRALMEYHMAVRLLNQHIATNKWKQLDITLICSVLCIAFDSLRGNWSSTVLHLRSSLAIIKHWSDGLQSQTDRYWNTIQGTRFIRATLFPIYTRLVLQTVAIQKDATLHILAPHGESSEFPTSLQQVRDNLYYLIAQRYRFIDSDSSSDHSETHLSESTPSLSSQLSRWNSLCQRFEKGITHDANTMALVVLRMLQKTAKILLARNNSETEMVYDKFNDLFSDIVDDASKICSTIKHRFSIDVCVVPVLYLVAIKCRHSSIRHRAVAILRATPRREGIWDSKVVAEIADLLIRAEEAPTTGGGAPARIRRIHGDMELEQRRAAMRFQRQGETAWSLSQIVTW